MIPLNRFETVLCRPSPTPTPSAPVNSANVVRSTPMLVSASTTASVTSVVLISFPSSTRARGVISEKRVMRRSNRLEMTVAAQRSIASESTPRTIVRTDTLRPPTTIATLSSKSSVGPSRCMMLSAATTHASTAIRRADARQNYGGDLDEVGKNEDFIEQVPLELLEVRHHVLPDRECFDFHLPSLDGSVAKNDRGWRSGH